MRWRSCSTLAAGAALLVAVSGCVTSVTRYYAPSPGAPRATPREMRDELQLLLGAECPRLLAGRPSVAGGVELALALGPDSAVTGATIVRESGDARVDDIIGGLAAELTLRGLTDSTAAVGASDAGTADSAAGAPPAPSPRPAPGGRPRAVVLYSCTPAAAVATVTINGA